MMVDEMKVFTYFVEGKTLNIIVAPDSFKGSLTAIEAAQAMGAGISDVDPTINAILLPAADGGEGTMRNLITATKGKEVTFTVQNPIGRKVEASYGILGDGKTCVIEIAEASGLLRLDTSERDPLLTSTYGTGELIRHALDAGFRKFIIGLGGSATNDAGAGLLSALGMKLFNKKGVELKPGGGFLIDLHHIDASEFDHRIAESRFLIASDVENPFVGENGASVVFGPQKGATSIMVEQLDQCLTQFANVVEKQTGTSLHEKRGAGAAGGAGGAFLAFFPAELKPGIHVVLEAISFHEHLKHVDLVITGEGKTDSQTLSGKAPFGIAKEVQKVKKPIILISGSLDEKSRQYLQGDFTELHAVSDENISKADSMNNAYQLLRQKTRTVVESYLKSQSCRV